MKDNTSILLNAFVTAQDMVIKLCDLLKFAGADLHPIVQTLINKRCEFYETELSETVKKLITEMEEVIHVQKSND